MSDDTIRVENLGRNIIAHQKQEYTALRMYWLMESSLWDASC